MASGGRNSPRLVDFNHVVLRVKIACIRALKTLLLAILTWMRKLVGIAIAVQE